MRKIGFLFIFSCLTQLTVAQTTILPDTNFRNFLVQNLPFVMNQNKELINSAAASYFGQIDCSFRNINDLTGIEKFTNLSFLYCYNNNLTNVNGVKNLTKLITLHLDRNKVTSLPDLSQLTNLANLYCSSNELTALPDLSKNTSLVYIDCFNNQITAIKGLDKLVNLQTINCYNNAITSLPDLSNLSKLYNLQCHGNKITSIPGLTKLTSLTSLYVGNNPLDTLPDLSTLTKLQQLYAWSCNLSKAPVVSSITSLIDYDFNGNLFKSIPSFGNISNLMVFHCQDNQLDSLPTSLNNFANLQEFHVSGNKLVSLPNLPTCKNSLREFHVDNNKLSTLPDLSSYSNLYEVQAENNHFTFEDLIPFTQNTSIKSFSYSPQAALVVDSLRTITEYQPFVWVLGIDKNVKNNIYTWYKDGVLLKTTSTDTLVVPNTPLASSGIYTCQITNPLLPDLTLTTTPLKLNVTSCIDISKLSIQTTDFDCNIGGKISIKETSISGGTKPYTYILTSSESGKKHFATDAVISNLFEKSYQLQIADQSGCISSTNVTLKGKNGSDCVSLVIVADNSGQNNSLNIAESGTAKIFNKSGQLVKTLNAPTFWDGTLNSGEILPGLYVMELNGNYTNITVIK